MKSINRYLVTIGLSCSQRIILTEEIEPEGGTVPTLSILVVTA
jgi:hypothetical protein